MDINLVDGSSIVVGQPFFINMAGAAEGAYFEYRAGYGFLIFYLSGLTQQEMKGAEGDITLGLYRKDEVIFIECHSQICGYTDSPYSCRLAKEPVKLPDHTAPKGIGMPLGVAIVDEYNILRHMRLAMLSNQLCKACMTTMLAAWMKYMKQSWRCSA